MSYREFITENLELASDTACEHFGKVSGQVKSGDPSQVLTEADLAISKQMVAAVREAYPDHNIIDEEAGVVDNGSRFTWVIDPIDGTSNFAAGTPDYGVMIGLLDGATPIAGGVIAPAHNKMYVAEKGKGATCNGMPIHVSRAQKLLSILVSLGIDGRQEDPERTVREFRVLADIDLAIRNMRNSGCEAVDTMYVADGRFGGRVNLSSKIWDCIAPQIICEEAGAVWTDAAGNLPDYSNPLSRTEQNFTFCVASPLLHKQLNAIIDGRLR